VAAVLVALLLLFPPPNTAALAVAAVRTLKNIFTQPFLTQLSR
jgi:hypothetical protein